MQALLFHSEQKKKIYIYIYILTDFEGLKNFSHIVEMKIFPKKN